MIHPGVYVTLLMTFSLMTSSAVACTVKHVTEPSIRHVTAISGNDFLNMSLQLQETARILLGGRKGRLNFVRHFPRTESTQIDLKTLKISTEDGHSIPWIQKPTYHDQITAVSFMIEGQRNDVVIGFEYSVFIRSEAVVQEDCHRFFHTFFYPVTGEECEQGGFEFGFAASGLKEECQATFSTPMAHVNVTPAYTTESRKPEVFQISLKCLGGETCTCACQGELTDFCRDHLTDPKVKSLLPSAWYDVPFMIMMAPFFLSVMVKILFMIGLNKSALGWYLEFIFNSCLVISVTAVLFFSFIVPVHMDATTRACSTVFESQGGYFLPLLFWTYFPYVITLLIATGFIDSVDLVVAWNGNLKIFFVLYQILSPLAQIWLFMYIYVIPINDALLLSAVVLSLSGLRIYLRNPFRMHHE